MTTHVLMITDGSGSMRSLQSDVIGGQNAYLDDVQSNTEAEHTLTQVLFNVEVNRIDVLASPEQAIRFDRHVYSPHGGTALYDAIGETITWFESFGGKAPGDRVLVFIQTDGEENSSREWGAEGVKALLAQREANGWAIVYSGMGPDGWSDKDKLGRSHASTMTVHDAVGTKAVYESYATATREVSRSHTALDSSTVSGLVQRGIESKTRSASRTDRKRGGPAPV